MQYRWNQVAITFTYTGTSLGSQMVRLIKCVGYGDGHLLLVLSEFKALGCGQQALRREDRFNDLRQIGRSGFVVIDRADHTATLAGISTANKWPSICQDQAVIPSTT